MNTLSLTPSRLKNQYFSPLQSLAHWLGTCRLGASWLGMRTSPAPVALVNYSKPKIQRPLRVVRIMETGQSSPQMGRMLISGSFSDVCAELDRMAARESAAR